MAIDKAYTLTMGGKTWAVDCPKVEHVGGATILPNVYNVFGTIEGQITITKGEEKPNVVNNYIIRFTAGTNCSVIFSGWELTWVDDNPPIFKEGRIYEISIIDNLAMCVN